MITINSNKTQYIERLSAEMRSYWDLYRNNEITSKEYKRSESIMEELQGLGMTCKNCKHCKLQADNNRLYCNILQFSFPNIELSFCEEDFEPIAIKHRTFQLF